MKNDNDDPVVLVSSDSHVGPRLVDDLRPYCPASYLDEFDRFAADNSSNLLRGLIPPHPNLNTAGHYDSKARLADYDYDGVAAAVLFHGSQNGEPLPFVPISLGHREFDAELVGVGQHIYNRWLADFVADAPHRHIGLAHLSMWDPATAIREVEETHDAGLRGVNLPAIREGVVPEYNDPVWEPFWAVCEERRIPLVTHVGGGAAPRYFGPESIMIHSMEGGGWMARRAIWYMIFGGVFERHPRLKLAITETPGNWWPATAAELDSIYDMTAVKGREVLPDLFTKQIPRHPSEYMATNVFFGASFTSAFEAHQAIANGVDSQLMWGSDYPHVEGTFVNPEGRDMPSVTRLALRNTFCDVEPDRMRRMVGGNLIDVYNLDRDALQQIAIRIDAPTAAEIAEPIDAVPAGASTHAFRSGNGPWM